MVKFGKTTRIKVIGGTVEFRFVDFRTTDFARALDQYERRLADFRPVFADFWSYHRRSIDRNFAAQGRPKRWRALSRRTIAERRRLGFGAGPILKRTGTLQRSFKASWGKRSYAVTNTAKSRNGYPYFFVHQHGGARIPQRVMVVLLKQDRAEFTKILRRHVRYRGD